MEDSWIGLLRKVTDVAGENKWVDNTPFDYRDFGHLEPKYEGTGDFCGQIITNGDELSKWKVVKCDKNASAYVCKKAGSGKTTGGDSSGPDSEADRTKGPFVEPLTGTGPFPHEFKGNKYGIFYDPEKVTFLKARLNCRSIDGELASIHSKEEVEFLKSIVQLNSTLMEDAWIGMVYNVSSTDVQKKWVDESAFDYSNFAPLEPKFSEDGVYCGQIITNGDELSKWQVVKCDKNASAYVCKKAGSGNTGGGDSSGQDSGADRTKGPSVEPLMGTGPFPHEFKGNKYGIFYDPEKVTFLKARLNCRNIDGELASIHSKEEVEFLKRKKGKAVKHERREYNVDVVDLWQIMRNN
ncbi:lectin C-type domain protein [Ancylostoma caninum]|uniref:Lectin C-type domain protein n=1 Tax=Ancylostoma caninum TaxID=29170 RepID=A0A368G4W5_ANCCA|nr:lectin C-type domain protein [Ancylostoma caninum]